MFSPRNYCKCAERPNKTGFNLFYVPKVAVVLGEANSNYVAKKSNDVAFLGKIGAISGGLERDEQGEIMIRQHRRGEGVGCKHFFDDFGQDTSLRGLATA